MPKKSTFGNSYSTQSTHPERILPILSPPDFPKFTGHGVHTSEDIAGGIIQRYIKSARMSIFTCNKHSFQGYIDVHRNPQPYAVVIDSIEKANWLVLDNSVDENILAVKLETSVYRGNINGEMIFNKGGVLILPDFGINNVNVALALLQEFITVTSPHLFDTPQHPWLEKHQATPVVKLIEERNQIITEARQKLAKIDTEIEEMRREYNWLTNLLTSTGDDFCTSVAAALRFLGFEVEEVDELLAPGERKREDLRIRDAAISYFALGEAKTTGKGRGASEDFISKTQTHQAKYAREHHQPPPPAILIVNFAIDLEPTQRVGRFYQLGVKERLQENRITAINSVALFDLCQFVLVDDLTKEQARKVITSEEPIITLITPEMLE